MIVILTINSEKFSLNGIPYFKNFMPHVVAGMLKIVNVYDSKFELCELQKFSNYSVDGVVFSSLAVLQDALLPVIYTRNSLNSPDLPFFNKIISETGFSLTGQELKINPLWRWMFANVNYSNPTEVKIPIPFCAPGKSRIDYVVPNNSNGFDRIAGVESDTIPVAPPIPNEGIYVTFFVVTDGAIDEPANPNPANTPSLKQVTAIGSETERAITILEPGVRGIDIDCETLDFWTINGLRKSIRMIWTNIANGYDIRFPAKPEGSQEVFAMVSDFEDYYTKPEIDSKISSVYKFKGNVANFAALPTTGLTIGDVYNVDDTGDNYAWTGTVWDKLSGTVDISGKEDKTNKTEVVAGNETSITQYLNIKGAVDYFQQKLTDVNFGAFINFLTSKTTPIDADSISILDSVDLKQKKVSLTNLWLNYIKNKIDVELAYACSDEVTPLTVNNLISFRAPFAMTLSQIRISVNEASTVSSVVVDVKENGVSIFSTLLSIDATELTSVTAAIPAVISDVNIADDALLTVSTTQVGSGNAGKGLKILFKGKRV
jgi:hypothetical protein